MAAFGFGVGLPLLAPPPSALMGEENRWPRIRLLAAAAVSGCCCDRGRVGSLAAKFTVTLLGALSDFAAWMHLLGAGDNLGIFDLEDDSGLFAAAAGTGDRQGGGRGAGAGLGGGGLSFPRGGF